MWWIPQSTLTHTLALWNLHTWRQQQKAFTRREIFKNENESAQRKRKTRPQRFDARQQLLCHYKWKQAHEKSPTASIQTPGPFSTSHTHIATSECQQEFSLLLLSGSCSFALLSFLGNKENAKRGRESSPQQWHYTEWSQEKPTGKA